jgi:hypothetical protein
LIDGKGSFGETGVSKRDAVGFGSEILSVDIKAESILKVLIFEVPL